MTPTLSPNTQAILLLTAPLMAGRRASTAELLTPGEYKRLARRLRDIQHQPADLVSKGADEVLRDCESVVDASRLKQLLGRGFLLSQAIERWQTRAIWVISRADAQYPARLKARMREDAPAVLYGCGDISLLETGGLAVVGSRHVDESLVDYTMDVGRLAARAGRTIVSGGAKGIDQAAMRGALEAGGKVCGVLANGLEKTAMNRDHRNPLLAGELTLISPYDPSAGFDVGNAMQRNKVIYGLAGAALVVSSDLNKGGTWAGATEQLDNFKYVPVFVRSTGESSVGLDALRKKGARPWPNPQDVESFEEVFTTSPFTTAAPAQAVLLSPARDGQSIPALHKPVSTCQPGTLTTAGSDVVRDGHPPTRIQGEAPPMSAASTIPAEYGESPDLAPAELLFVAVCKSILQLLNTPMKDSEVATALDVSNAQAKAWLTRLVDEGVLEKQSKPVRYVVKQERLFD